MPCSGAIPVPSRDHQQRASRVLVLVVTLADRALQRQPVALGECLVHPRAHRAAGHELHVHLDEVVLVGQTAHGVAAREAVVAPQVHVLPRAHVERQIRLERQPHYARAELLLARDLRLHQQLGQVGLVHD
jgi:hypothetical protein